MATSFRDVREGLILPVGERVPLGRWTPVAVGQREGLDPATGGLNGLHRGLRERVRLHRELLGELAACEHLDQPLLGHQPLRAQDIRVDVGPRVEQLEQRRG